LPHEEDPNADQQQHREPRHEHAHDRRHVVIGQLDVDLDALLQEAINQIRMIGRRDHGETARLVSEFAADALPLDRGFLDLPRIDLLEKLGVADLVTAARRARVLKDIEQRHEK